MIDKEKAGVNDVGSSVTTDELVDYLNSLDLTDEQYKRLEELIYRVNSDCECYWESAMGEEV